MSQVTVYTTPSCPYCRYVKQFLNSKGVPFVEKDVASDQKAAMEMVRKSGQQGVPVTVIEDEVIVGFNQPALNRAVTRFNALKGNPAQSNPFRLGAQAADAAKVLASQGKPAQAGALLGPVRPGSAAERAGLREGDIIIGVGSHTVRNVADLQKALSVISNLPITGLAGVAPLAYIRDGQQYQTRLPLR